jgi:hypothetical protein
VCEHRVVLNVATGGVTTGSKTTVCEHRVVLTVATGEVSRLAVRQLCVNIELS